MTTLKMADQIIFLMCNIRQEAQDDKRVDHNGHYSNELGQTYPMTAEIWLNTMPFTNLHFRQHNQMRWEYVVCILPS